MQFRKNRYIILFFILLSSLVTVSQSYFPFDEQKVDSLMQILPGLTGETRTDALNGLGELYARHYPEKSIGFSEEALQLAQEQSYVRGEALANFNLGTVYHFLGDYARSTGYLYAAHLLFNELDLSIEHGLNDYLLGNNLFTTRTNPEKGLRLVEESIRICDKLGYERLKGLVRMNLSVYWRWDHRYDDALRMNDSARLLFIEKNLGRSIDKGIVVECRGDILRDTGNIRGAINLYLKGITYYDTTRIEDLALKAQACNTLGKDYLNSGKPDSALWFFRKGINIGKSIGNVYNQMINFLALGNYYLTEGKTRPAVACFDSALYYLNIADSSGYYYLNEKYRSYVSYSFELYFPSPVSFKRQNVRRLKISVYKNLISVYRANGEDKKAIELYELKDAMEDSVHIHNMNTQLKEIAARYETEQKDRQIQLLSQENQLREIQVRQSRYVLFGLGGMVILVVIIALLFIRQGRLKSQQQNLLLRQKLFRSQMNPHFIFNSLASIQNTIISDEPAKASKYLARFSKLMRNILDSSVEEFIPLEEEIETIENYLALQKFRFPERFDYHIEIDKDLDTEGILIPPMLIQPFIENCIEHGMKHKKEKGNIRVRINRKGDALVIEVEDDGVGREKAGEMTAKDHKSLATGIIRERIKTINKNRKQKITLNIRDLFDDNHKATGTLVQIRIPLA